MRCYREIGADALYAYAVRFHVAEGAHAAIAALEHNGYWVVPVSRDDPIVDADYAMRRIRRPYGTGAWIAVPAPRVPQSIRTKAEVLGMAAEAYLMLAREAAYGGRSRETALERHHRRYP